MIWKSGVKWLIPFVKEKKIEWRRRGQIEQERRMELDYFYGPWIYKFIVLTIPKIG